KGRPVFSSVGGQSGDEVGTAGEAGTALSADWRNEANSPGGGVAQRKSRYLSKDPSAAGPACCSRAPAELVIGAVPGAFEGGDLALDADEEFGSGGFGEEHGGEGVAGRFGEDGAVEIGLDNLEAALLPIGAEHGIDVEGF